MTRGWLPHRAGSPICVGGGDATVAPPQNDTTETHFKQLKVTTRMLYNICHIIRCNNCKSHLFTLLETVKISKQDTQNMNCNTNVLTVNTAATSNFHNTDRRRESMTVECQSKYVVLRLARQRYNTQKKGKWHPIL